MAKEETREDDQALPPVETEEEEEQKGEEEKPEGSPDADQDIDFAKELEALENGTVPPAGEPAPSPAPKSGKTEEEKAGYTARETIKRLKKQGKSDAEISALVGFKVVTEEEEEDDDDGTPAATGSEYVTKRDLHLIEAEKQARELARYGENEVKVIMWYVTNKGLSVADAHILANKGRIKRASEEIARAGAARPAAPVPAGQKPAGESGEKFTRKELDDLQRRGFKWNPKEKRMEGKFMFVALARDPATGERISGKMPKK